MLVVNKYDSGLLAVHGDGDLLADTVLYQSPVTRQLGLGGLTDCEVGVDVVRRHELGTQGRLADLRLTQQQNS